MNSDSTRQPIASTSKAEPLSVSESFRPYFNPVELVQLNQLQATKRDGSQKELTESKVDNLRQLACGFIEKVGGRLGL